MKALRIFAATAAVLLYSSVRASDISPEVFASPSHEYGPMTWWHWINGNVTKEGILADLSEMNRVGIRGVQMFNTHMYVPEGPVEFGTDEWFDLVHYAIEVCDSLDMKFTCMTGAGWSGSGGPWISKDQAMKRLVWSEQAVSGGKVSVVLPMPKIKDQYYVDEAVLAVPSQYAALAIPDIESKTMVSTKNNLNYPAQSNGSEMAIPLDEVIDLTDKCTDGCLKCTLPHGGGWTIIRFGYTLTGKKSHPAAYGGEGYEVDKFSPEAVEFQWDNLMGRLCNYNAEYLGNTFEGILFDSYEASWQNWTGGMMELFRDFCGYDLKPWLPLFTGRYVQSAQKSEDVLYDFRRFCDHLIVESFYGTMQRKANEVGMVVYAEGQGGPVPSYAMDKIDVPMNEFWTPDAKGRLTKIKLTATQADLRGHNVVAAEAFTSKPENGKWQNTPATMKKPGDLAFAGGINRYCFHTYAHQPLDYVAPGFTLGRYGIMLSRLNTWWDFSPAWMTYITRSQYVLQQGRTVADICFLFHDDIRYNFPSGMVRVPQGTDYMIAYPEQFDGACASAGEAVLPSGLRARAVVYVDDTRFSDATRATIAALKDAGIPVLRYSSRTKSELEALGLTKDIDFGTNVDGDFYYLHRRSEEFDYYYITNQTAEARSLSPEFRVAGRQPEIWDPVSGTVRKADIASANLTSTKLNLDFGPYESYFVVFRQPMTDPSYSAPVPKARGTVSVTGPWTLEFCSKDQMPGQLSLKSLESWSENADERVKYYSGTAVYRTTLKLDESSLKYSAFINLGRVKDIARVEVNGIDCGILWTEPFAADITKALRPGDNEICIYVADTWINRVIGDEQLPSDIKYETGGSKFTTGRIAEYPSWLYSGSQPKNRKRFTFCIWKHYDASSPLVEAGLLGPVEIEFKQINAI